MQAVASSKANIFNQFATFIIKFMKNHEGGPMKTVTTYEDKKHSNCAFLQLNH